MNEDLADVFDALEEFSDDPLARQGIDQLTRLASSLRPTLRFLTPTQTVCNYATLWFRNVASLLSDGDPNGTWQRFQIVSAPTDPRRLRAGSQQRERSLRGAGERPARHNHLHFNPYPNTAAPGQTRECEAGNEATSSAGP